MAQVNELGIRRYTIILLDSETRGQAETVYLGLLKSNIDKHAPITIFNIDTFRPGFKYPIEFDVSEIDGYLETFIGGGENWSNIKPVDDKSNKVLLTAEKRQISKYCCTGLYYWKEAIMFIEVFNIILQRPKELDENSEYFIAPMYNYLITAGSDVRFSVISRDELVLCGTPDEYNLFLKSKSNPTL